MMDVSRSYGGSAFSEYYPNTNSQSQLYGYSDYSKTNGYINDITHSSNINSGVTAPTYGTAPVKLMTTDAFGVSSWSTSPGITQGSTLQGWDFKTDGLLMTRPTDLSVYPGALSATPKRKRKTTPTQRQAANIRERRRMCSLNTAFDRLRRRVPAFPHEKRLSRIQTLRLAITYISFMTELISGQDIRALIKQSEAVKPMVWQPYELAETTNLQTQGWC